MTTTELSALLETPAAFRAWLEAKESGEVVGSLGSMYNNPLTRYLERLPGRCWAMAASHAVRSYDVRDVAVSLVPPPMWVQGFFANGGSCLIGITAAECLRILDGIEGEEG